jgi:cytochrome c553
MTEGSMNGLRNIAAALLVCAPAASLAQQPAAPAAGNAEAGRAQVSTCSGCHAIPGYQASFPRVYRVPKIGGQSADYIVAALQAYQRGERNHPTMMAIAKTLTDQQMADIAAYYAARGAATK